MTEIQNGLYETIKRIIGIVMLKIQLVPLRITLFSSSKSPDAYAEENMGGSIDPNAIIGK